ncbi:MAG: hypothetical protein K2L34_06190, partial [Muribaculaceae bacterium]|nr:hypothetical protein [Muribaculaceae bacterium]
GIYTYPYLTLHQQKLKFKLMKNPTITPQILSLLLLLCSALTLSAESNHSYEVSLQVRDKVELKHGGRRSLSRPIFCIITQQNGIDIPSVDKSEIMLYEIYDEEDNNIFTSVEEETFIDYIFTTTGTVRILLHLPEYNLVGCITL